MQTELVALERVVAKYRRDVNHLPPGAALDAMGLVLALQDGEPSIQVDPEEVTGALMRL